MRQHEVDREEFAGIWNVEWSGIGNNLNVEWRNLDWQGLGTS
jgi:hypothetical protein